MKAEPTEVASRASAATDPPGKPAFPPRFPKRFAAPLVATALAVVIGASLLQLPFDGLQASFFDVATQATAWRPRTVPMALVAYDDSASRRFGDPDRIPVGVLIATVETIARQRPRAVLVLGPLDDRTYRNDELEALGRAFEPLGDVYVGFTDDSALGRSIPGMDRLAGR